MARFRQLLQRVPIAQHLVVKVLNEYFIYGSYKYIRTVVALVDKVTTPRSDVMHLAIRAGESL